MPQVILNYSDAAFKKLQEYAFINSRPVGDYLKRSLSSPAKDFESCEVRDGSGNDTKPSIEPLNAENTQLIDDLPLYISDKPAKPKAKNKKKRSRVCVSRSK